MKFTTTLPAHVSPATLIQEKKGSKFVYVIQLDGEEVYRSNPTKSSYAAMTFFFHDNGKLEVMNRFGSLDKVGTGFSRRYFYIEHANREYLKKHIEEGVYCAFIGHVEEAKEEQEEQQPTTTMFIYPANDDHRFPFKIHDDGTDSVDQGTVEPAKADQLIADMKQMVEGYGEKFELIDHRPKCNKYRVHEDAEKEAERLLYATDCKINLCFSGGKDSVAMVLDLIDKGIDMNRVILWYHDVDGAGDKRFGWQTTMQYCEAFAQAFGLQLRFAYRKGGIAREMDRENEGLQDIIYSDMLGHYVCLESKPGSSTRKKFPAVTASLMTRWCSSVVKIDVLRRVVSTIFQDGETLILTGERREESNSRATYAKAEDYARYNKSRLAIHYRPIIDWTEEQVWEIMRDHNVQCNPVYELGWNRASCMTCIFSNADIWATVKAIEPSRIDWIAGKEKEYDHTLYNGQTIEEKAASGRSILDGSEKEAYWIDQATRWYRAPILVTGEWVLPKGAFREATACGSV